jgi:two-component SAPR family response regulator
MAFIGLFYEKSADLWAAITPMMSNFWIYIVDEHALQTVRSVLKPFLQKGEIFPSAELGLREPVFRYELAIQKIKAKIAGEKRPLTLFLEMSWAVRTPSAAIYLRNFYLELHKLIDNQSLSILCLYNESILLDEQLLLSLYAHPMIFTQAGLKPNPYYLPPAIFQKNAPRTQFHYWLSQMDSNRVRMDSNPTNFVPTVLAAQDYHIVKLTNIQTTHNEQYRWKIRCLGNLKVYRNNGQLIDWNTKGGATKKIKTLFAYLLFKGEKGASTEELADLLWSNILDTTLSTNRLYHTIRYLREILEGNSDHDFRRSSFLLHQNNRYYLTLPPDSWMDLPMFQELCFKGNEHFQQQQFEQALMVYQAAERLYQGDLLTDIPQKYLDNTEQDWCWSRRFWYRDMYHKLLYSLAAIQRQMGHISEALNYCEKAFSLEPSSEPAHREKLLLFAAANRMDAVHRQYRLYCESLKKFDLGTPSQEMMTLYAKIMEKK